MDEAKRSTLRLIVEVSARLDVAERGQQLIYVVRDYLDADEAEQAREVLKLIEQAYFVEHMFKQAVEDRDFALAVATVVDAWGHDFWFLAQVIGSA